MPVLFLLPIRDPEPEGIEMIEAVSPRITPFQFRVRHAVADHGSGNFLVIGACFFFHFARHADGPVTVNRKDPFIFLCYGFAAEGWRKPAGDVIA